MLDRIAIILIKKKLQWSCPPMIVSFNVLLQRLHNTSLKFILKHFLFLVMSDLHFHIVFSGIRMLLYETITGEAEKLLPIKEGLSWPLEIRYCGNISLSGDTPEIVSYTWDSYTNGDCLFNWGHGDIVSSLYNWELLQQSVEMLTRLSSG